MNKASYLDSNGDLIEYESETIMPHGNFQIVYEASFVSYKIEVLEWEYGTKRYTYQLYDGTVLVPMELKGYETIHQALTVAFRLLRDCDKNDYIPAHDVIRIFDEIPSELLRFILLKAFIPKFTRERILAKMYDMHRPHEDEVDWDFESVSWEVITHLIVDKIKTYKSKIGKDDTVEGVKTGDRTY